MTATPWRSNPSAEARTTEHWLALMQLEQKREIAISPGTAFRGYQALGENVTRYEGGFQRDHHEAIDLYREAGDLVRPIFP